MRVANDYRTTSKETYDVFCKKYPNINVPFDTWKKVIYSFNGLYKEHLLETGDREKLPQGLGQFAIIKKKRRKVVSHNGTDYINLPIDWKKTKEKGKIIYNFNFHTEGYFFGWHWFKENATFRHADLWYFKACRFSSRLITEYINKDNKYQHLYKEWKLVK
jgi:hypothetical protein